MKTNFNEATQFQNASSGSTDFKVQFFSIKPGEQAIVRILVDSEDDLCAYGFHEVEGPDGKPKKVDCIRSLREDISKCPLCAANVKFDQQIYIHLLQYYPDGHVEAKVWGRKPPVGNKGTGVIDQIRKALSTYGKLSDYVSSITRTGTGLDTSYSININLPDKLYPPTSFPLDVSAFEDYSEIGTIIKSWTAEEMTNYIATGTFPAAKSNTTAVPFNTAAAQPAYQTVPQQPVYQQPIQAAPQQFQGMTNVTTPETPTVPFNSTDSLPFGDNVTPATAYNAAPQTQPVMDRPIRRMN